MHLNSSSAFVSIGLPVFNDKLFLRDSIESILNQTFTNFELIISDDFSTDGSQRICEQYASKDDRITYIRQAKNIGISKNMEYLKSKAAGEFFMWAGNDDILDPYFIEKLLSLLLRNPDAVMAYCTALFIDDAGNPIEIKRTDYSGPTAYTRLKKMVREFEDSCGYGLFRKEMIKDVRFPVWWWVNRRRAYNNIFPTLCYYLAKGQYCFLDTTEPLFFKRIKLNYNNHVTPYTNSYIKGLIAFTLWKINLLSSSLRSIFRGSRSIVLCMKIFPEMVWKWVMVPTKEAVFYKTKSLFKGEIKFY